jgi:crotonobetainyl-CoA:carnitine CoA-transferase CaiB-like acyl-CoA transferase
MSGLMSVTGDPGSQPQKVGVAVTDVLTGVYASTAILAALHQRTATGAGQQIDMSLLDVATSCMANQNLNYLSTGVAPQRLGNAHPNLAPYQVMDCSDGWVIIAVGNEGQFVRFCALLGLASLAEDARFVTNADRVANRDALTEALSDATTRLTKAQLLAACEAHGVPAGPINDMADLFDDPQIKARGMQLSLDGVPSVRSPFRFSDADLVLERSSPKLGADTDAVLGALRQAPKV